MLMGSSGMAAVASVSSTSTVTAGNAAIVSTRG